MRNKKIKSDKIIRLFLVCLFFSAFFTFVNVQADDDDDFLDDKYDQLEDLEKDAEKTQKLIDLKQKEQDIIGSQVNRLEKESREVEDDIEINEKEIEKFSHNIDRIEKTIDKKEDRLELQRKILGKIIREYYQENSDVINFFTIVKNTNTPSLFTYNDRLDQTADGIGSIANTILQERADLDKEKNGLENEQDKIEDAKHELEKRNQHLESSQSQKKILMAQAGSEKQKYKNKLSDIESERLNIQNEINNIDYSFAGEYSMADLPSKSKADFDRPVIKPYVITQSYGKTGFSHNYKGGLHNGVDYVAQGDKKIMAAAKGKVLAVGDMGRYGYGKWIAIDHDNGLVTLYGHMSSTKAKKGEKVKKGEKIGTMGNTGFSTGPHLHFTIFVRKTFAVVKSSSVSGIYIPTGATINPANYL